MPFQVILRLGAWLLLLAGTGSIRAGSPYQALDAGDMFIATITAVENQGATYGKPPVVRLEVLEVIRGDAKAARSPAVWLPPFHGIDTGNGVDDPVYLAWERTSSPGPKIGDKLILGGRGLDPETGRTMARAGLTPVFGIISFVRIPYSDKAKADVMLRLKTLDEWHRASRDQEKADAAALVQAHLDWQAPIRDEDLVRMTAEAPLIVSVMVREPVHGGFTIERYWKGRSPFRDEKAREFRLQKIDPKLPAILKRDVDYLLFLSTSQELVSFNWVSYGLVDPAKGMVLATKERQAIIERELAKLKPPPALPMIAMTAAEDGIQAAFRGTVPANHRLIVTGMGGVEGEPARVHKALLDAHWLVQVRPGSSAGKLPPAWNVHAYDLRESFDKPAFQEQWPRDPQELAGRAKTLIERIEKISAK